MSKKESTTRQYEDTSYKKRYVSPYNIIRKKSIPFRISKKIKDMKSYVDNIYQNFFNNSTDRKKQKEIEEYNRLKKLEKIRRINFIKNLYIYFKSNINPQQLKKSKSVNNILDTRFLYFKIINKLKMKSGYNSKNKLYIFKIKKEEKIRINCITESGLIDVVKNIRMNNILKQKMSSRRTKKMSMQKLKLIKSNNDMNYFNRKSSTNFNIQNIVNKNFQKYLSEKNNRIMSPSPSTRYVSSVRRNNINTNKMNKRVNSCKINIQNKNIYQNYNSFQKNNIPQSSKNKVKTVLELKKYVFKILPVFSSSFRLTLNKSRDLKKDIHFFQKEARIRSESSKKQRQGILKQYFIHYEIPSIKSSLRTENKNKNINNLIKVNKNGKINVKFILKRKEKSPLIFVEDYNKMRNRRRKNSNIEKNLGMMASSVNKERKTNKTNTLLGMTFNDLLKGKS